MDKEKQTMLFREQFERLFPNEIIKKKFVNNVIIHCSSLQIPVSDHVKKLNNCKRWPEFIVKAFIWRITEEGEPYWNNLANSH